jgi:hypothetical protein
MDDTPDTTQRLAEIRDWAQMARGIDTGRPIVSLTLDDVEFLLDHIDTLTAKLAEVGAERDRLRGTLALSDDFPRMATSIVNATIRAEKAEAERDALRAVGLRLLTEVGGEAWEDLDRLVPETMAEALPKPPPEAVSGFYADMGALRRAESSPSPSPVEGDQ